MWRSGSSGIVEGQREAVGVVAPLLALEMEQAGVISLVGCAKELAKLRVDRPEARDSTLQTAVRLAAPVLGYPQEDDAVNGHLHRVIEVALSERGIAESDLLGQQLAPLRNLAEESSVHRCRALARAPARRELVERAIAHRFIREQFFDFGPVVGVFLVL